jgi:predicted PurR-regulated permease PerM
VSEERSLAIGERRGLWLLVAILLIAWLARAVIGPFIVAAVLAYAFTPIVSAVQLRTGWPRIVVVAIGYAVAIALLLLAVVVFGQKLLDELGALSRRGPDSIAITIREIIGADSFSVGGQSISVLEIAHQLQAGIAAALGSPSDALHLASLIGEFALNSVLALIVMFYFLLDGDRMGAFALRLVSSERRERVAGILMRIHDVLGRWLRGQLFLIALVAFVVYLILGPILHLPFALAIALLTGFLEIIPLVGPIVATAIAAVDAFAHGGPNLAITVVIVYFVLRQIEDQLVAPVVIGRAVHLHPVVTIFAVLVGLSTFGVLGGLLGVPVAAAINVTFRELYPTEETTESATEPAIEPAIEPAPSRPTGPAARPAIETAHPPGAGRPAEGTRVVDTTDTPP